MFQILYTKNQNIRNYHDLEHVDVEFFSRVQFEALRKGILFDVDYQEVIFSSFSHGKKELDHTLRAFEEAAQTAQRAKRTMVSRAVMGAK